MKTFSVLKKMGLPLLAAVVVLLAAGCDLEKSPRGFRLPDGNIDKGKEAFVTLQCNACHSVSGDTFPTPASFNIPLGGETPRIRTYGELVTSIINPSHVISARYRAELREVKESPMMNFNDTMTVSQMIDLVAFLQSRYKLIYPDQRPPYYPW
jgi:mono/diheme cytochrome c family protein